MLGEHHHGADRASAVRRHAIAPVSDVYPTTPEPNVEMFGFPKVARQPSGTLAVNVAPCGERSSAKRVQLPRSTAEPSPPEEEGGAAPS